MLIYSFPYDEIFFFFEIFLKLYRLGLKIKYKRSEIQDTYTLPVSRDLYDRRVFGRTHLDLTLKEHF